MGRFIARGIRQTPFNYTITEGTKDGRVSHPVHKLHKTLSRIYVAEHEVYVSTRAMK